MFSLRVYGLEINPALSPWSLQGLETMLAGMRVRYLVVPSVKTLVPMWRSAFGFTPLSLSEFQALEERCASL